MQIIQENDKIKAFWERRIGDEEFGGFQFSLSRRKMEKDITNTAAEFVYSKSKRQLFVALKNKFTLFSYLHF